MNTEDFTKALAECIKKAQCAVVDPMAHAEIWKEELLELAKGKEPVSEDAPFEPIGIPADAVELANIPNKKEPTIPDIVDEHWWEMLGEEPVSEELEEAAKHYLYSNILYDDVYVGNPTDKDCIEMFKAGAKWQFKNLMNKVMDWLPNAERYVHINVDNNGGVHTICYTDKMVSDFREAMGVKILMMDTPDSLKIREYLQVTEIKLERVGFVFDPYNPPPDTIVTESNEPLAIYDKAKKC